MGLQEGIQDIVNEAVEKETAAMRKRILNLELVLGELIARGERNVTDAYSLEYAKSVLEGKFE